jgi:hypothetical protein
MNYLFHTNFHILGATLNSLPFVESFVTKAFQEDLNTVTNLPMLTNLHATLMIFLFCYTLRSCYLLHIVYLSPSIL